MDFDNEAIGTLEMELGVIVGEELGVVVEADEERITAGGVAVTTEVMVSGTGSEDAGTAVSAEGGITEAEVTCKKSNQYQSLSLRFVMISLCSPLANLGELKNRC